MAITIKPASHGANEVNSGFVAVTDAKDLLKKVSRTEAGKMRTDELIQSSFKDITSDSNIHARRNGFVDGAVEAYNNHQHLEIRPDDVWLSILSQLNIYINKHAEELRDMFVAHEGQKHLEIIESSDIKGDAMFGVDWGKFSYKMSKMIAANIKDPSLRDWILPQFTTTRKVDQAVASIMMMATLQKYFTYGFSICCGLPSVTLLGQKADWERLLAKADRIATFGDEPKIWLGLLKPVLSRFVTSFDAPEAEETREFWQKIAHYSGGGSGPTYLSGWITAFCFWDAQGNCFYRVGVNPGPEPEMRSMGEPTPVLQLDEARYHRINTSGVPPGWASVPIQLDDNGHIIPCTMVAGSVGTRVRSSGRELHGRPGETGLDTISIESGWWMFERDDNKQVDEDIW